MQVATEVTFFSLESLVPLNSSSDDRSYNSLKSYNWKKNTVLMIWKKVLCCDVTKTLGLMKYWSFSAKSCGPFLPK